MVEKTIVFVKEAIYSTKDAHLTLFQSFEKKKKSKKVKTKIFKNKGFPPPSTDTHTHTHAT